MDVHTADGTQAIIQLSHYLHSQIYVPYLCTCYVFNRTAAFLNLYINDLKIVLGHITFFFMQYIVMAIRSRCK